MQFYTIFREDRTRTSGPGLRAFNQIADWIGLNVAERIAILGSPPHSTYSRWMKTARERHPMILPLDTLLQISAFLGIYKALTFLFEDENQALVWLKGPHQAPLFAGTSPLACMLTGGHNGLMAVRQYLDAWRTNTTDSGGLECQFEIVTENDLHFI